jgi:hypothetical protein
VQSPTGSGTPNPNSNTPGNSGAQQPLLNGVLLPALVAGIAAVGSAAVILLRLRNVKRTQGRP